MLIGFGGAQVFPLLHAPERDERADVPAGDGLLVRWWNHVRVCSSLFFMCMPDVCSGTATAPARLTSSRVTTRRSLSEYSDGIIERMKGAEQVYL